jgi:cation diffusion facilitator family transporter
MTASIQPLLTAREQHEAFASHAKFAINVSLAVGILMFFVKLYAYFRTGSAAILSDAAESIVHNIAVGFAAFSIRLSFKPADREHMYGHDRISFFSAGFEGMMIVLAACFIIFEAIHKWIGGLHIENIGTGIWFTVFAIVVNGILGFALIFQGRKYHSIVLEANGKHVLTDSWTSFGVVAALLLTQLTGWLPFDPCIAILIGLNILTSGAKLMRKSIGGLMDESDPKIDKQLNDILRRESLKYHIEYHHLRHRNAGNKLLIEFHLLFPDDVTVALAHEQATNIENEIHKAFPYQTDVISHLEPREQHDEVHSKLLDGQGEADEPDNDPRSRKP